MAELAYKVIKKGTTSKLLRLFIFDSSVTTRVGKTGLAFNTGSLVAYYIREGEASPTAITLATMTVGTWVSGGFKEVDATNMPGLYEFGIPDICLATGANSVIIMLKGASGMAPAVVETHLVDYDPQDAVRLGLTSLPNVVAAGNGGLPTVDASNAVNIRSSSVSAIWNSLLSSFTTASSIGKKLADLVIGTDNRVKISADAHTAGAAVASVTASVTVSTNSDKTGYGLSSSERTSLENQILNATASSHNTAGSIGEKINRDFLDISVPGSYGAGKVGKLIGDNLDAKISTRSVLDSTAVQTAVAAELDAAGSQLTSIPDTTGSLRKKINFLFQYFRNKRTATASIETLYKEDTTTALGTASLSNDTITVTKGEMN